MEELPAPGHGCIFGGLGLEFGFDFLTSTNKDLRFECQRAKWVRFCFAYTYNGRLVLFYWTVSDIGQLP
jgi:hypothetical protein